MVFLPKRIQRIFGILLISSFCLTACESYKSSIPDMPVRLERDIYLYNLDSERAFLAVIHSNVLKESTGFGGIMIVHAIDGYYAFDMACPHELNRNVRIGNPDQGLICTCDSCGEAYDLSSGFGNPTKNISKEMLRRYRVQINGTKIIVGR